MTPLQGILLACLSTEFDMPMPCKQDSHSMTSTSFSANCWLSTTFRGRTNSKVCGGTPWKRTLPITRFVRGDQVAPLRRMLLVLPDLDTPCSKSGISIGRSPFRSVAFVCPRNAHWFSSITKVNTLYKYRLYIPKRTWSMAKMSTTKGPAREVNINEATWQTTQKHNKVESTNLWYSPSKRTFVLQRNIPNECRSQTRRSSPRNGNRYFKARWNWAKWRIQNAKDHLAACEIYSIPFSLGMSHICSKCLSNFHVNPAKFSCMAQQKMMNMHHNMSNIWNLSNKISNSFCIKCGVGVLGYSTREPHSPKGNFKPRCIIWEYPSAKSRSSF